MFSRSDLSSRLHEAKDLGAAIGAPGTSDDGVVSVGGSSSRGIDELLVADVFDHLAYRATIFTTRYPFRLNQPRTTLRKRPMARRHSIYLFLLLASSLPHIARAWYAPVTRGFEQLVAQALRRWLSVAAEVHVFGTSGYGSSRYTGGLFRKLQLLSQDLNEQLLLTRADVRRGDTGDAGADVVAWLGLGDRNSSRLVILAQAACGQDWIKKQHESGDETWSPVMRLTAPHTNVIAIPYFFRSSNGEWAWRRYIRNSVLIDRQRLMWLFGGATPTLPIGAVDALIASRATALQ